MMKNFVFLISLFFIMSLNVFAQHSGKKIYRDYGVWELNDGNNKIAISAYVTVENKIENTKSGEVKNYLYEIYLASKSIYNGDTTRTWLYGVKIFVNDIDITSEHFSDGFTVAIPTKAIKVYWYETEKKDIKLGITWEKSIYDPRIRE